MNGQKVLGIIFSNSNDESLAKLTEMRTMGSVPFCARYRLIDFPLSAMVRNGMTQVGIVTKSNFKSLMDHIGTGKPWDLARKNGGMFLLPPFNQEARDRDQIVLDSLYNNREFIRQSNQEYVLLSSTNTVTNVDLSDMFDFIEKNQADAVILTAKGKKPNIKDTLVITATDSDGRITDAVLDEQADEEVLYSTNVILIKKYILETAIDNAYSRNKHHFIKDIIMERLDTLKIYSYSPDVFTYTIDSLQSYFDMSMSMLDSDVRKKLFSPSRPVYTKVRDDMPVVYGPNAKITNSLVADGCIVEGTVENSILFRGVKVKPGAVVKNSIIMQDSTISANASVEYLIADKNVFIKEKVDMKGAANYPICISKNSII